MRHVRLQEDWPTSWRYSHAYDQMEVYGQHHLNLGYSFAYQARRRLALALVRKVAAPPAKVLDVAAAQGNFTLALAELGYDVTWNDLRGDLAGYVQMKWEKGAVYYAPGNVVELTLDTSFDVVLAAEVIEHVAHPDEFLHSLARFVKPGGHVVLTTPNGGYFRNLLPRFSDCPDPSIYEAGQFKPNADGHIFLLHLDEVGRLAAGAGLRVVERRLCVNPLTGGGLGTGRLLRFVPQAAVNALERLSSAVPLVLAKRLHMGMAVLLQKGTAATLAVKAASAATR